MEILEAPPDELLRSRKRRALDEIMEEDEINDQTVLIGKDGKIDETYDQDEGEAYQSGTYISDHGFGQQMREEIDREGMNVGTSGGLSREEEERRRLALLAALRAGGDSVSLCSHATSSIPDGNEINFQEPNLAMLNITGSEDSMEEQDMVFYPKEDQTQYSKPLGLNRAPRRSNDQMKLSEDDISDDTSINGSKLMGDQFMRGAISDIGEEPYDMHDGSMFDPTDAHGDGAYIAGVGGAGGKGGRGGLGGLNGSGGFGGPGSINGGPGGINGNGGLDGVGVYGSNGENDGKKRRRIKKKSKKLTSDQKRKLRKMNEIYGQDAEELGLSPRDKRYGSKGRKNIKKKGVRDGNMSELGPMRNPKETDDEARARRFKQLNLIKPKKEEGEYDHLKRKLKKFRKRKDISFWLDYDSPYAEYLPARFREWAPETKTGLNLDANNQNLNANGKAHELSRIYSRGLKNNDEDRDPNLSRNEDRNGNFLSPDKPSGLSNRPKSNASMNLEVIGLHSSSKKSRQLSSTRKKSNSKRSNERPPKQLDLRNNFMLEDSKVKDSNDALNENTHQNNDFDVGPLYDEDGDSNVYQKAADDDEIDFRPVKFNHFFNE